MAATRMEQEAGTRAVLRYCRMSAFKVRPVLDLIRGRDLEEAQDILRFSERDAAIAVGKLLDSAVANADHNDSLSDPDELFVSACFADEATTMKRWRPRARGRATRIRKRTSHITVVVTRVPDERLARRREHDTGDAAGRRARRVAGARRQRVAASRAAEAEAEAEAAGAPEVAEEAAPATGTRSDETGAGGDAAPSEAAPDVGEEEVAEGGADAGSASEVEAEAEASDESEQEQEEEQEARPRRRTRARREKRDE